MEKTIEKGVDSISAQFVRIDKMLQILLCIKGLLPPEDVGAAVVHACQICVETVVMASAAPLSATLWAEAFVPSPAVAPAPRRVGVLSACSHSGLVERGRYHFYYMKQDYGTIPNTKHYTCMIDILGRAGHLDEAQNLVTNMPFEPDAATWGALLGASRIHGNTTLGEKAAKMIFALEPWNTGMYVLLSNLYASSGRWIDVNKMRSRMRDTGIQKVPGYSWVEVQNNIHMFSVGDSTHAESDEIYAFLEELDLRVKENGYVSATKMVLHDVEDEEKQHMLRYHSEKLAVAYGIMKIPSGRPIRVFKNLRVCEDCHTAIKHVSKIVQRQVILRDPNRFHHFEGGVCNCGDYW